MNELEIECLNKLKVPHDVIPLLYTRYVDDSLMIVDKDKIDIVLEIFNSYHDRLNFTHELQNNNSINFLNITIISENTKLFYNWYTKPTSSNRKINFNSKHRIKQKKAIVFNLVDRAILLAEKKFHNNNINTVKIILKENEYPIKFIEKHIAIRLNKIKTFKENQFDNKYTRNRFYALCQKVAIPCHENNYNILSSIFKQCKISTIPLIKNNLNNFIRFGKDIIIYHIIYSGENSIHLIYKNIL